MLFAGIDGGQSATVAAIGDGSRLLARGAGPPADLVGQTRGSIRQAQALATALVAALDAAGLERTTRFAAIVAGLSGFEPGSSAEPDLAAYSDRVEVVHDTAVAHAGALAGAAGIVVIAGTGSVALGNDGEERKRFARAGGWGYFFGDEGSALWIARSGLRRAMLRADRGEAGELGRRACAFFGAHSLRAVQDAFAHGELTRPALAAFARELCELAAAGDPDAGAVCAAAARELAELAATVDRRLGTAALRLVSYAGGVFADEAFLERFGEALEEVLPHANLLPPAETPEAGALLLARALR